MTLSDRSSATQQLIDRAGPALQGELRQTAQAGG